MIYKIVDAADANLRKKSKPVAKIDKKVKALIADMKETLEAQVDPEGVGLAAPQVGKNVCIFLMKFTPKDAAKNGEEEPVKVIINPEIVSFEKVKTVEKNKKREILEGCLSLPHFYGPLVRSKKVILKFMNEDGKEVIQTFVGFPAQIVLHEMDHLDGKLFVDRLLEQGKPLYEHKNGEWFEVELT